jgi:hypothetical protein
MATHLFKDPLVGFEPGQLHRLADVFVEVWSSVEAEVGSSGADLQVARDRLAAIVLELAADRQLDDLQVARTADRLIREEFLRTRQTARG